jgi:cell division protein FtsQ
VWSEARIINRLANTIAVLAVLAMLAGCVFWLINRPIFRVQTIEIEPAANTNLKYVSPMSVQAAIAGKLQGNFFTINLNQTRRVLETVPWIRTAMVRRVWPSTLRVTIEEQQPWALWNENQMISTWGQIFTANQGELDDDALLPQFIGPEGTPALFIQRYAELERWLAPLNATVRKVVLSERYAMSVTLSNGLTLELGRDPGAEAPDPQAGIPGALPFTVRIRRFVQAWPVVLQRTQGREITHVDLRYTNGFALTLAALPETPSTKKKR